MAVLSEWPFQNPEIANHPDADQKINFDPPVPRASAVYSVFISLVSVSRCLGVSVHDLDSPHRDSSIRVSGSLKIEMI